MSARRMWLAFALCLLALPAQEAEAQSKGGMVYPSAIADHPLRVTLAKPTAGQTFVIGSRMPLWADAEDIDDDIQSIWFQVDGVTVAYGGITSWVVTSGSHTVRACASNYHVPMKTACTSTITIYTVPNQLPTVALTAPVNGSIYGSGTQVLMTATASDSDGTIQRVEFWVDGSKVGQDATSPYTYSVAAKPGNQTMQARATDDANGTKASATVTIYGNTRPVASLTSPANGAVYTVGTAVPLAATASDLYGGSINRVEFWVDGASACQDATSPYACNWIATSGAHSVLAKAFDNMGEVATTAAVSVTGNPPPAITLTAPGSGASPLIGSYLSMTATASDGTGSVEHVEFLVDGVEAGRDYSSPYAYDWHVTAGNHNVRAMAVDTQGATATTAMVPIRGNEAPTITLPTPASGAIYPVGALVGITATAGDDDGSINRVEFWVDGAKVGQDTTSPYAYDWTATAGLPPGGNHAIQAKAIDDAGATAVSGTSTIHIAPAQAELVTRTYTYNAYQELCRVDEPETGATLMGYDAAGNLAWSASGLPAGTACSSDGNTTAINARKAARTYDARSRVATLSFPDLNGNQSWSYTPDGLPASVTTYNDGGTTSVINTYAYNRRRMLDAESSGQPGWYTWWVTYGYDTNGHQNRVTLPDGFSIDYAPNALGQPTQAGSYATGVSYFPNGAIRQFTYGNGIVHTLTQNSRGLPEISQDAYGATAIHQDEYAYDQVGNVLYITDAATGQGQRANRSMAYDGLNRLTSTTSPMFGTATYAYNVLDDLKHVQVTGGIRARNQDYCYDEHQRLTNVMTAAASYCAGATVVGLGYDVQGNLAKKNGVAYAFDYGNRLRAANGLEGYRYDVAGRRVLAWSPAAGSIVSMYGQGGVLRFQANQRNQNTNIGYIYLGGSLMAIRSQDVGTGAVTVKYQHTDALGSPVAITNSSRTVIERREYEPYGYQLTPTLQDGPNYTGHVADAATGLVYMQQRYYDPLIARFLSRDAVTAYSSGDMRFFNAYAYVFNNPYRSNDPDGRCPSAFCNFFGLQETPEALRDPAMARADAIVGHDSRMVMAWWGGTVAVGASAATGAIAAPVVKEGVSKVALTPEGKRAVALACSLFCRDPQTGKWEAADDVVKIIEAFTEASEAASQSGRPVAELVARLLPLVPSSSQQSEPLLPKPARTDGSDDDQQPIKPDDSQIDPNKPPLE